MSKAATTAAHTEQYSRLVYESRPGMGVQAIREIADIVGIDLADSQDTLSKEQLVEVYLWVIGDSTIPHQLFRSNRVDYLYSIADQLGLIVEGPAKTSDFRAVEWAAVRDELKKIERAEGSDRNVWEALK